MFVDSSRIILEESFKLKETSALIFHSDKVSKKIRELCLKKNKRINTQTQCEIAGSEEGESD